MKIAFVLMLCALAAAAPKIEKSKTQVFNNDWLSTALENVRPEQRSILVNALVRQLIAFLRLVINQGSAIFGIPPLDPLVLESYRIYLPTGFINIDMLMEEFLATGFGGFEVHRSDLNLRDLTFDIDISVPRIEIDAKHYDLIGDVFSAIPLFGKGEANFVMEQFRFRALLFLRQSDDGASVLIDRIENSSFEVPRFRTNLTGAIGGGDIDAIFNAMIDDVIVDYVNRFQGAIASLVSYWIAHFANPVLDQLDTWRFIAPLLPR